MQPFKRETTPLHTRICEAVKSYIMEHDLKPGDRLPSEHEMAEMLGVSRASVREAMTSLNTLGILEIQVGRGAFVRDFNLQVITDHLPYGLNFFRSDLEELVEIRRLLEVYAIQRVADHISDEYLAQLRSAVAEMADKAEQGEDFIDADIKFHSLISEAANRNVLRFILNGFWQLQRKVRRVDTQPETLQKRYQEHKNILEALERRDTRGAIYYMEVHFDRLQSRIGIPEE